MAKPQRPTLASFAPQPVEVSPATVAATTVAPALAARKYPKVSVYLTADEVRTLKLIGVDTGKKISDLCAAAVREWLEKNGHARGTHYKA